MIMMDDENKLYTEPTRENIVSLVECSSFMIAHEMPI